jgi:uncharacterized repeat protein (TIGR01451 family)
MSRLPPEADAPARRLRASVVGMLAVSLVSLGVAVAGTAAPAQAAAEAASGPTATFTCTGYAQQWAVPDDVNSLTFDAIGASGAQEDTNNNYGNPGEGAEAQGTVPVTPGELLTVTVGCSGQVSTPGYGYTHGGAPGSGQGGQIGTAGGGSSGVVAASSGLPLVVAGGGGGGGGQAGGGPQTYGGAGGNGSQAGDPGGSGGGCGASADAPGGQGGVTGDGTGQAGQNDESAGLGAGTGGGGGGGYSGGGGGGAGDYSCSGGGGGGGSSYLERTATDTSFGATANAPQVAITYTTSLPVATPATFTCTGTGTTYQVPGDVDELDVIAVGAVGGGSETVIGEPENQGAGEHRQVSVTPGQVLTVGAGCVGGRGSSAPNGEQVPGGYGLANGGIGGAGSGSGFSDGSSGGGSSGLTTPTGTVLVEAAGGGGGCDGLGAAPYAGGECDTDVNGSGNPGASGAPGNNPAGQDGTDGASEQAGSGGGGSTYGPGGGGGASAGGSLAPGGSGGSGLSYPGEQDDSGDWGTGNVDPTSWYDNGEPTNNGISFFNGTGGLVAVSPTGYLTPTADLAVSVVAEQSMPTLGSDDTYEVTLTNRGPDNDSDVTVGNTLPSGPPLVSATATAGTTYDASTGVWSIPEIDTGTSVVLDLTVQVSGYGSYRESSQVTSTGPDDDPTPGNNAANASYITAEADLAVTNSVTSSQGSDGQNVDTYTITATNNGPSSAGGADVTNTLPADFVYQSSSATVGTVTGSSGSAQQQWAIGNLDEGQSETLTVVAQDPQNKGGMDTAAISATSPSDPDQSNNTATATTTQADLAITNSVSTTYNGPGRTIDTYTITATNNGPDDAAGVVASNTLPNNYLYQSSTATAGTVTASSGSAAQQWDIGTLPSGAIDTLTVVAGDPQDTSGIDSAAITSSSADPEEGNNSATVFTASDIQVSTSTLADSPHATVGQTVQFTTAVLNGGPANLTSGTVTVYLPSDLAFVGSDTPGTYDSAANSYTWQLSNINGGGQSDETLQATVLEPANPTDSADRTATVSSVVTGTTPANNSPGEATSAAVTTIDPSTLTLNPATSTVEPGAAVTYTATGTDPDGVSDGDVTAQSSFTIAPAAGAGGSTHGASCQANACTATAAGTYTVTAADGNTIGTATLTVAGPWAKPAGAGWPRLTKMSPVGIAIGVRGEDWRLEVTQPDKTPAVTYTGTITLDNGTFTDVKARALEPKQGDSYTVNGGQITFHFANYGGLDGLSWITPTVATAITFELSVNGQPAAASEIHLGPTGIASTTNSPITVDRT